MRPLIPLVAVYCVAFSFGMDVQPQVPAGGRIAGEIRVFAIDVEDPQAILALHRAGWLEAAGQLLSTADFPEAYAMIGNRWTAENVPPDRFALPDLRYLSARPGKVDRVTRELLGGDLVTGGRNLGPRDSTRRLLYCVYVAAEVSDLDSQTGRRKRSSR